MANIIKRLGAAAGRLRRGDNKSRRSPVIKRSRPQPSGRLRGRRRG